MGPDKDSLTPAKNRGARSTPRPQGGQQRARHPRRRVCLLKGCGRVFRPQQPLARYCSEACQTEARRWRQWKARRRYRQSTNGKQKRQAQSRRYRERRRERQARETLSSPLRGSSPRNCFSCSCDRPGCYVEFDRTRRSPLQRFCCPACRHALERVLQRERRWRERREQKPGNKARGAWHPLRR